MVVFVTKRELEDEDWKTHIAQGKERIPAGAKVELVKRIENLMERITFATTKVKTIILTLAT